MGKVKKKSTAPIPSASQASTSDATPTLPSTTVVEEPSATTEDRPYQLLQKYYNPRSRAYRILVAHSECVANKALEIARSHPHWDLDMDFIREAALLHDIGVFATDAPGIGCTGTEPYIRHGVIGSELLVQEGLPRHALVCERHTGVGLTLELIQKRKLPLPPREMIPVTLEEQIICFADCFYSKSGDPFAPKSIEQIIRSLQKHGEDQVLKFKTWCKLFL